jgi:catechol 2,3-dioxygenase-like lactoylglutathione lyase family enzyme
MELRSLGYIGIHCSRAEDWNAFASRLLGMQRVDRGGGVQAFRVDDRAQRLVVTGDEGEGPGSLGWEVADAAALDSLAARLEAHGVAVRRATRDLADQRHVTDLIAFEDPAGNRLEVFHGPAIASDPFVPGGAVSGFRTGPLGIGHAVMHAQDVEPLLPF